MKTNQKYFFDSWKTKTELERKAINSLNSAKEIILSNIPKGEIISIYVKGSFIRREMNEKSDVDTVTILKTNKYLPKIKELEEESRHKFKPEIQILGYSIEELKTGIRDKSRGENKPSSSRFVKHLKDYKPIYGKTLKANQFFARSDKEDFDGMIKAFREIFLPAYENKKYSFSEIIKQVFWLVESEQTIKGKNPPHHWQKLADSIKDKSHIIHDTLKYRLNPPKSEKEKMEFIEKLNKFLERLK